MYTVTAAAHSHPPISTSISLQSIQNGAFQVEHFDNQFTGRVLDLLSRDKMDINHFSCIFFNNICCRLPLVNRRQYFSRLNSMRSSPNAHFSLLVLCMALVTRPALKSKEGNPPGNLYYTAKSFHSVLSSTGNTSLELLQAGLLIAFYEYCQALFEAARLSIWACAIMGSSIGIERTLKENLFDGTVEKAEVARCVWWGTFILER